MRVIDVRERFQVNLQHRPGIESFHGFHLPLVAPCQRLREILRFFAGELFLQHIRAQSLLPERVRFRGINWARRIVAVERIAVLPGEIEWFRRQRLFHERSALLVSLEIALEITRAGCVSPISRVAFASCGMKR